MKKPGLFLVLALSLTTLPEAEAQRRLPPPGGPGQEAGPQGPGRQPGEAAKREPVPLVEMYPWLQWERLSTWRQETTGSGPERPTEKLGVFPLGDGWCFGYLGLGRRANTLQGLTGPSYRPARGGEGDGTFGATTFDLEVEGRPLALPRQKIGMVRGAPILWTEEVGDEGISLRGATFVWSGPRYPEGLEGEEAGRASLDPFRCAWSKAPHRTIYRIFEIHNDSDRTLENVRLLARFTARGEAGTGALLFSLPDEKGRDRRLQARFVNRSKPVEEGLERAFDKIAPGGFGRAIMVLHFYYADDPRPDPDDYLDEDCLGAIAETQGWWHLRLKETTRFRSDDRRLADLVTGWKVMATTMQALPGGGITPMVGQHGVFARDQGGMLLAFLRFGMWTEARRILDYYYDCVRHTGEVRRRFPAAMDFPAKLADPEWEKVKVADNETAAWILLQHYWYYRATTDWQVLRDRWPFLVRLARAQEPVQGCLFPIPPGSDLAEGGMGALFPEEVGYPNELIAHLPEKGRKAWSYEGTMLHLLCLHGLSDIAGVLSGRVGDESKATWEKRKIAYIEEALEVGEKMEEKFWLPTPGIKQEPGKLRGHYAPALTPDGERALTAPYAPVNLMPFWVGFLFSQGNRDTANVKETVALLPHRGARVGTTPSVGHFMGYTQGYLVASLAQIEDRSLPAATEELLRLASPSGGWARLYGPDGKPLAAPGEARPLRHRPWESGVNLDALLFALTGIRYAAVPAFDPSTLRLNLRLPGQGIFLAVDGAKHDDRLFDFAIRREGDRVKVRVLNRGTRRADLALSLLHNMYIRYLEPNRDVYVDEVAPGVRINDENPGYREEVFAEANRMKWMPAPLQLPKPGTDILFVTYRPEAARDIPGKGKVCTVDVGLPITPHMLAQMFLAPDGRPRVRKVVFDTAVKLSSRRTMKNYSFWQDPKLREALEKFRGAGGTVEQR